MAASERRLAAAAASQPQHCGPHAHQPPHHERAGREAKRHDAPLHPPADAACSAQRRRILVVDDNAVNRAVAQRLLQHLFADEFEVVTAVNGLEAVAKAAGCAVILMDLEMPRMNGLDATERIRALGGQPPLILAWTTASELLERAAARRLFDGSLPKPMQLQSLSALLPVLKERARWPRSRCCAAAAGDDDGCCGQRQLV